MSVAFFAIMAWALAPITVSFSQKSELTALRQNKGRIRAENRQLRIEIKKLKGDKQYWETLARRNMGFVKSDEEAFLVVEEGPVVPEKIKPEPQSESAWERFTEQVKELSLMF